MTEIIYYGPDSDFIDNSFGNLPEGGHNTLSFTSTLVVIEHPTTGMVISLSGSGIAPAGDGFVGTLTGIDFEDSDGNLIAEITDISWSVNDFVVAFTAADNGDDTLLNAFLFDDLLLDASQAVAGAPFYADDAPAGVELLGSDFQDDVIGSDFKDLLFSGGGDDQVQGGDGNDTIRGGAGDDMMDGGKGNDKLFGGSGDDIIYTGRGRDTVDVGTGSDYEQVFSDRGDKTIIYTQATTAFQALQYGGVKSALNVTVDGDANTGTIQKGAWGTDTLVDVQTTLLAGDTTGGIGIDGSIEDDVFNWDGGANTWASIRGGLGVDSYNLDMSGTVRLNFDNSYYGAGVDDANITAVAQEMRINVATGTINNDGWGNSESISVTAGPARLEISGTFFDDVMNGSGARESFITSLGNDTVNGKGGVDRIRFDRGEIAEVEVDLSAGVATVQGTDSNVYTQTILNVEDIRGSKNGDDGLTGSSAANYIQGRGGNDDILGLGGADRLYGEDGRDGINGGGGSDIVDGGAGRDILKGGNGNDTIIGGTGADVMFGNNGDDVFIFASEGGSGNDKIRDFVSDEDTIRFEGVSGTASFSDLTITVSNGDTLVEWAGGSVKLLDFTDTLTSSDFDFFLP